MAFRAHVLKPLPLLACRCPRVVAWWAGGWALRLQGGSPHFGLTRGPAPCVRRHLWDELRMGMCAYEGHGARRRSLGRSMYVCGALRVHVSLGRPSVRPCIGLLQRSALICYASISSAVHYRNCCMLWQCVMSCVPCGAAARSSASRSMACRCMYLTHVSMRVPY